MDNIELAQKIIDYVGGKNNITRVWNCMTRIRFNLIDNSLIKKDKLTSLVHIINIQQTSSQFQIIIGKNVDVITKEINNILTNSIDKSPGELNKRDDKKSQVTVKSLINNIIETITSIFSPILPAIIGAGMMKVVLAIITTCHLFSESSGIFLVCKWTGDSAFYFLPFLLAVSSAKKFNVNEYMALCLSGVLMAPALISGSSNKLAPLNFMSLELPYMNYSSSIIPIILAVFLMRYIDKFVAKILPKLLVPIFQSLLVLIITVPIMLIILAPLGFYIGELLSKGLISLFSVSGPIAGGLLAGFNPLIVMTGMHYAFMPAAIQSIETNGFDNFWLPFALISNLAQTGALLAVFFKYKTKKNKSIALSTGISAFFGISEPGLYGVTLKLKKPLYAAMIGGAIGGIIVSLLKVKTFAFTAPNIFALPTYISIQGDKNSLYAIIIGGIVSLISSFILCLVFKYDLQESNKTDNSDKEFENSKLIPVYSPLSGTVVSIKKIPDPTFSEEIIGKGVAIEPDDNIVYAPFDGHVSVLFHTKHAIGLTSNTGVELIIHIGLDTVELEGKYFTSFINSGDKVYKGDKLIQFDLNRLKSEGYNLLTPIVVTNYQQFNNMNITDSIKVSSKDKLIELIK